MIKLAIADQVVTSFYLTLDADVIFTRPLDYSELIPHGRALLTRRTDGPHLQWLRWSERALGRPWDRRHYSVTPALLAREAVLRMFAHFLGQHQQWARTTDRDLRWQAIPALIQGLPWTEYTLYGIFVASDGILETFHLPTTASLYGNCLWRGSLDNWDPRASFDEGSHFFSVIQSTANASVDEIVDRVGSYILPIGT
jgi:hypothetical protein